MSEYISCDWIQHGLNFENDHIEMCCLCCHKGGGRIYVKNDYNGKGVNWDDIFKLKQKYIEDNQNGIIDPRCEGCWKLVNKNWDDDEKYINYIHFNHWTHCNSDCIYCFTKWDKANFNKRPHYNALPMVKELFNKNLFRPDGEITFAGGEPTILNEFEDIINFLLKNNAKKIIVHSNGIIYSNAIEQGIKSGVLDVCLSADSGTRNTYLRVKEVDEFDKFWQNVERYAKAQTDENKTYVKTKYIIIPGINDNKEEVEKWFSLNLTSGVKSIAVDIENEFCKALRKENKEYPQYLVEFCKYIVDRAKELNLNILYYNNFRYLATEYNMW